MITSQETQDMNFSLDAVTMFQAATVAQTHVSNIYKQRAKLRAFKHDGTWMVPTEALQQYIQHREVRARKILGEKAVTPGRRAFKRPIRPVPLGEFLSQTGLFVRVELYSPLEAPVGTAVAELEISLEVSYKVDADDSRGAMLQIQGCFLHQRDGQFWVSLPDGILSFPYPEEQAVFELSVFKDLCKSFPTIVPTQLIPVTEELQRKEQEELSV
jgi:hypothetical protein